MVIDHASRLHVGIANRFAKKFKPFLFHIFANGLCQRCKGWHFG